jgi:hypothetical protein
MKNPLLLPRHSLFFLILLLLTGAMGGGISARAADVPKAPRQATIIVSSTPTRVERFAAWELSKYLAAATGIDATVVHGAPAAPAGLVFWVGARTGDDRLARDRFPLARLGDAKLIEDGVCIDGDDKQVLLVGQGERGALNAVYTYLESVVGCHWPEPGRDSIPHIPEWKPAKVRLVTNPQFAWRAWGNHGHHTKEDFLKIIDWQAKNRMNSFQLFPTPYSEDRDFVINAVLDRGLLPNIGGHSRDFFLSGKKYLPEHPDWFSFDEGKRTEQLNYANEASLPTYIANVVAFLKKYPEIKVVSLWPNDGYGFNLPEVPGKNGTDILLSYVNKLAAGIHAEVPEVQSEFLAYIMYTAAPLATRPEPYVMPTFCEHYGSFGARDHWHPITDDRAANKALRTELEKWVAMSTQVTEFSYYGAESIKHFLYHPIEDVMVADCHYYHKIGLAGNVVELSNPQIWWTSSATIYAYARAAWDGSLTADQIETDYYSSLYGPAAPAMRRHADELKALYDVSPAAQNEKGTNIVGTVDLTGKDYDAVLRQYAEGFARANAALAEALTLAKDDWTKERVRKLQSVTGYIDDWLQIQCGEQHLAQVKSAALKAHILALIDHALNLEVIAGEDAHAYGSATKELQRTRDRISAIATSAP